MTPKRARNGAVFAEIGEREKAALQARVDALNARGEGKWSIGAVLAKLIREAESNGWGEKGEAP